jgi:hypothetical protein
MEVFLRGDLVNLVTDISESEEKENQEVADKLVLHACYMCYMRKLNVTIGLSKLHAHRKKRTCNRHVTQNFGKKVLHVHVLHR